RDGHVTGVQTCALPISADSSCDLCTIFDCFSSRALTRAVSAAEEMAFDLDAVTDHLAAAVLTDRRHRMDGALKAIEDVLAASRRDRKSVVVFVTANFTSGHSERLRA